MARNSKRDKVDSKRFRLRACDSDITAFFHDNPGLVHSDFIRDAVREKIAGMGRRLDRMDAKLDLLLQSQGKPCPFKDGMAEADAPSGESVKIDLGVIHALAGEPKARRPGRNHQR